MSPSVLEARRELATATGDRCSTTAPHAFARWSTSYLRRPALSGGHGTALACSGANGFRWTFQLARDVPFFFSPGGWIERRDCFAHTALDELRVGNFSLCARQQRRPHDPRSASRAPIQRGRS